MTTAERDYGMTEAERLFVESMKLESAWNQVQELHERRNRERDFAKAAGWQYDRYWETMTLAELREAQS